MLWEMKDFGCIICCVFGEGIVAWVGLDLFNFFLILVSCGSVLYISFESKCESIFFIA